MAFHGERRLAVQAVEVQKENETVKKEEKEQCVCSARALWSWGCGPGGKGAFLPTCSTDCKLFFPVPSFFGSVD